MFRHLVLVIFLCIIKIKSEQVIMQRIPVRQYAKYDLNENLEWFPAIVGGVPASIGEFPSQVSIQTNKNRHLCGGVLIDYDYILTAGHCVVDELGNTLESRKNTKKPNPRLYKATLTISNFEQCNMSYAGQLKSNMFCAKGQQQDSCQESGIHRIILRQTVNPVKDRIGGSIDTFRGLIFVTYKPTNLYLCDGILLDIDFAVVPSSCVLDLKAIELQVENYGEAFNKDVRTAKSITRNVLEKFEHKDFNASTGANDIAMLKIDPFDPAIMADILTSLETPDDKTECVALSGDGPANTSKLQRCDIKIMNIDTCKELCPSLDENNLCGTVKGQMNLCQSKLGSALICANTLAGILSYGTDCCGLNNCGEKSNLGIYIDISKYNNWIDEVFRSVLLTISSDDGIELISEKVSETPVKLNEQEKNIHNETELFYFEDPTKIDSDNIMPNKSDVSHRIHQENITRFMDLSCHISLEDCGPLIIDQFPSCKRAVLPPECLSGLIFHMNNQGTSHVVQNQPFDVNTQKPIMINIHYHLHNIVEHHYHYHYYHSRNGTELGERQLLRIDNVPNRVKYDSQGVVKYFPKAFNGKLIRQNEFKNFVSIQTKDGRHLCGGLLLDVDFVITASSCLNNILNKEPYQANELQIMNDALQNETVKNVTHIFRHPDYNMTTLDNDLAMLKINPFKWFNEIEMLTSIEKPLNSSECKIIGFGESEKDSPSLHKISSSVVNDDACTGKYKSNAINKLCVQGKNSACLEDPGSGLICDGELYGILSFGESCSRNKNSYFTFIDLSAYNVWIDETFRTAIIDIEDTKVPKKAVSQTDQSTSTSAPQSTSTPIPTTTPEQGQWFYQMVLDTCQLPFVTCDPVWFKGNYDLQCKRGYFAYGCFKVVKNFVIDSKQSFSNSRSIESNSESNRLMKFKSFVENQPSNKIHKTIENIIETEKSAAKIGKTSDRDHHWFERVICMSVEPFNHFNNFPQHRQWVKDCKQKKDRMDNKFYFPDDEIFQNKN
uniref:CSON003054 protein n=1 Tax=Culicoides sonorensis TaxID=179676 RepID=A0A336L267_CULSO